MAEPVVLHPERARAVITTKWAGGYKPVVVKSIESFMIDSNMDMDADNFTLVVGDPYNHLSALLNRDGEIRVQIFGIGETPQYLLTGLVDEVERTEDGSVTLSGRDRSSIATDTQAIAGKWTQQRANEFIEKRAREFNIATSYELMNGPVKKTIRQDGSETEWEFWYRLIRREQMWLWFTPDGKLVSRNLGYNAPPSYYFGTPPSNISASQASQWIPVESVSYRKTTQTRVGNVQVFYKGQDNKMAASLFIPDGTISEWEKRPLKYVEDQRVSTMDGANRTAREEIYESKVGALEIKITIPDLGFIIRQNRIARLRIPEIDLGDDWFIVGVQMMADANGFVQQIRLREKGYGTTRRIPPEPKTEKEPGSKGAEGEISECLDMAQVACRSEWVPFLEAAAHKYHSNAPYDLHLAILMAMMEKEGCRNVRQGGNVEWFKWQGEPKNGISTFAEYKSTFNNDKQDDVGVGPFQLSTQSFKVHADLLFGGKESELDGNRWLPEANIMTGAWVLLGKGGGSLREETIWNAVRAYNGSGPRAEAYMADIKKKVYSNPGYLKMVQDAISACNEEGSLSEKDEVPDDNARKAAQRLLDYNKKGWFYLQSQAKDDLQATVDGKSIQSGCGDKVVLHAEPLRFLLWILDAGYSSGVWTFITGHDCNVNRGGRSRHSDGFAADISNIGTEKFDYNNRGHTSIGNGTAWTRSLIIQVMQGALNLSIEGGKPKQLIQAGNGSRDKVIEALQICEYAQLNCYDNATENDHLDHIHIGY